MTAEEAVRAGELAEEAGDFIGASAAFGSLLDEADGLTAGSARFHLGRVSWKQGRYDSALALYEEARATAVQLDDNELRARVENAIGAVHYARGEYAQARAAYGVAIERTADRVMRAKILLNLGVIANIEGDLASAGGYYHQSRSTFRHAGDERGEALALHNIGMLHADREEWVEAEEAFAHALALFESQGNRQMIANVLMNRSEVSCGLGRFDEAIATCDIALTIYSEIGDEVGRGESMRWKGRALREIGRFDEAERVLCEAMRIASRTQVRLLEAEATRELGVARRARGDVKGGVRTLERAMAMFAKIGATREAAALREDLLHS